MNFYMFYNQAIKAKICSIGSIIKNSRQVKYHH